MFSWSRSPDMTTSDSASRPPAFEQILSQAKHGNGEAISALYRQFLPGIFGYIAARVPEKSLAEDLTSEVFLKMIEGLHQVRANNEASFAAWLLQIGRITVAGYYRGREKQPVHISLTSMNWETDKHNYDSEHYAQPDNHPEADPVHLSELRDEWRNVVQAMNTLTEEQRQVIVGRLIMGYDVATVAKMIGKKANAVKALQFRALQSLQRVLNPQQKTKQTKDQSRRKRQHQEVRQ
ncbi:RNA polymerase sigma factor [Dictyobacter formicarum]|uniref:RNA polymerase sigma factor n=1 Tax=Dictyobacter formicarum TaxID=2778368 RepID=A0ABQ3VTK3_9CHLR|nr:sigma-70 family RNA polymerase sigma factor [Dictyobacter formicarum]GHO88959.1 RNA polymerase sigma factor [Dictyobacter formicarum]